MTLLLLEGPADRGKGNVRIIGNAPGRVKSDRE
jgi:hypothetical protein